VGVALASLGLSAAMVLWLRDHPERLRRLIPSSELRQLVDHDFSDYYSAHPARAFGAQVWANNSLVAALCLFLGVTLIGTLVILWQNVLNVGVVGGAVIGAGHTGQFFGLILPHGMLELTAIFIAAGVGLRTGWAWLAPGDQPRGQALGAAGRTAGVAALGLAGVLLVSGAIEAFVTPSGLPTWARIGVGALVEAGFLAYVLVLGRRGVRAGATGDLTPAEQGDVLATA
jgi:uncharacterized membrane protein SpoIIM required for sporulation